MPAPYSTRHPARNNLFGTIRLFFHAPYGHLLPSPPRTMAPHTGFQILSHEQLSLARTHPTSQATSIPPAISAQGRIQTSTRTSSYKKDRNKNKGTGENAIHEANTITDTHPASQWPLQHPAAFPKDIPASLPWESRTPRSHLTLAPHPLSLRGGTLSRRGNRAVPSGNPSHRPDWIATPTCGSQ
jgi:hypothetical protein